MATNEIAVRPGPGPLTRSAWENWIHRGEALDGEKTTGEATHPWYLVIWLTGVDYFSTLGYQPGIALLAAGALSPIATAVLVAVTLFCALPIYRQVASRSYVGQGSIALLENLLPGWWGRILVLVLLGFAATDFVITMTLSAADAATHAVQNPIIHPLVGNAHMPLTLVLLALLAVVFLIGFKEAIQLATAVCIPYLILNAVVLARMLFEVRSQPMLFSNWLNALHAEGDWKHLAIMAAILFPRLALGLSGFETGVSVMPLIRGNPDDEEKERPIGRIRNARKLLTTAALIMSVLLLVSSFVSALFVPPEAYREGGAASGRVISYLAHRHLGEMFGSIYDLSTILILWFAGASAMAGLLHLIPRYLPRVGLAPQWVAYARPLVLVLFAADVLITLIFRANVDAQGGAYATGVLVLMTSAAIAACITLLKEKRYAYGAYCGLVVLVFVYTTIANIIERRDGIIIASFFILFILILSAISRYVRATELRVEGYKFCNEESEKLWHEMHEKKVNLVPVRSFQPAELERRAAKVQKHYCLHGPIAFAHVHLLDNRSEFVAPLEINVTATGDNYLIEVSGAVAIANALAFISEILCPAGIFLGLSRNNLMRQSIRYFLLGEGETGLMVYTILQRYWEKAKVQHLRPCIFLMSD